MKVIDLDVATVKAGLAEDRILLVDVREPYEFAQASIAGSVNLPLSRFEPEALPEPGGRDLVFLCAAGVRSVNAIERCQMARLPWNAHLAGGIRSWIAAGGAVE
ncbi:MAG: rhodanese-like domain-containing protein [Ancalomicrobiaceae bacterium]|nr:rhodanese-like domain-containing protein [Ancalomicrobiaceae bacterium]